MNQEIINNVSDAVIKANSILAHIQRNFVCESHERLSNEIIYYSLEAVIDCLNNIESMVDKQAV